MVKQEGDLDNLPCIIGDRLEDLKILAGIEMS